MKTIIGAFVASSALVGSLATHAATYNFYFNNTEQGDNSTATPNLSVTTKDGEKPKVEQSGGDSTQSTTNLPGAEGASSQAKIASRKAVSGNFQLMLMAGPSWGESKQTGDSYGSGDSYHYEYQTVGSGFDSELSLGYAFGRYLGVGVFGGIRPRNSANIDDYSQADGYGHSEHHDSSRYYYGLQAKLTPLHVNSFGAQDVFEFAVGGGVFTLPTMSSGTFKPFGMVQLTFNLDDGALPLSVLARSDLSTFQAMAGLGFRF